MGSFSETLTNPYLSLNCFFVNCFHPLLKAVAVTTVGQARNMSIGDQSAFVEV